VRRVLVTGASNPLGSRVADLLRASSGVAEVVGVDLAAQSDTAETIRAGSSGRDQGALADLLRDHEIDTAIHCSMALDRRGMSIEPAGGDVIGTMRLCAALSHKALPIRSLVLASSSAVYPIKSYTPLLRREDGATETDEKALGASLLEAEDYARDVAERSPHLNVAILRLAEIAGVGLAGPLSALLKERVVPTVLGFDPLVQMLHVDDAARALAFAAEIELAGVYNVASAGVIRWREATRQLQRRVARLLPLEAGPLQPLWRGMRLPHVPNGMLGMLRFGLAMETSKLAAAGFTPRYDQKACLEALSDSEAAR
jgi:UDP-glucose 4-epimerase